MEDGETPEEAATREVFEETGLKISLLGERFPREDDMIRPLGIMCNRKENGDKHFDIIYAGVPNNGEIDTIITRAARLLSLSINCALQPNMAPEMFLALS